jgi:hypothetical protein
VARRQREKFRRAPHAASRQQLGNEICCSRRRRASRGRNVCLSVNWESRKPSSRCAIYTRVSTENGLEQEFNSLDNQREASEAYIRSQAHEGWKLIRDRYDDGGFSGGSIDRPALAKLLDDVRARRVDVIVVYKGRPSDKVASRLRQACRSVRRTRRLVHLGDTSFQHYHQHGTSDPQHATVFCAVRARNYGRAHPGQSRCFKE